MTKPFIKVEWEDTPENITQERIKRIKSYFQKKYNTKNVNVRTVYTTNNSSTKLKSLEASDNILDHQYQKKLVKEFLKENNIDIKWDLINRLDDKVNGNVNKIDESVIRYNKWYLKRVEYSNFLSFGQDNVIDFTKLGGITVIESEPKNFGGKSVSTIDLLMFLFFNGTTKTKINADIFNKYTEVNEVNVKGYVNIDDNDYTITRILKRKMGKSGKYTVTYELEFQRFDDNGDPMNLSGEQRRETEKIIAEAIGTQEDFLSTILTTGNNLEELIDSKPTARGQILTRFLGLESLKKKEDICKNMYSEWSKKLVSNTYNLVELQDEKETNQDSIKNSEETIENETEFIKTKEVELSKLETQRDGLLSSMYSEIDSELINTNPRLVQTSIDDLTEKQKKVKEKVDGVLVVEPTEYYLEEDHDNLKTEINNVVVEKNLKNNFVTEKESLILQLKEGEFCPTCKRPFDDIDHTKEIDNLNNEIEKAKKELTKIDKKHESLIKENLTFVDLKKAFDEYERNKLVKSKYELEYEQNKLSLDSKILLLEKYENSKKKLEENQKIQRDALVLKTQIETASAEIKNANINIINNKNNIVNCTEKIRINDELIVKIKEENEYVGVFKTYLSIYGKNGISKVILRNMIPLLNQELHRILSDSCYFILEFNINDKSEVEFLMIDNETRIVKPLTSGSGYEKTISALALRSVLTKVSSLPKPNIVVMDEVFGKIADENLEMVGEFFKKIKNYFEHIFLISHNPLIRNWSDNIIMIKKEDNISSIDYINTSITQNVS